MGTIRKTKVIATIAKVNVTMIQIVVEWNVAESFGTVVGGHLENV